MMRMRPLLIGSAIVALGAVSVAATAIAATPEKPAPGSVPIPAYSSAADIYPTNARGQTYGSLKDSPAPNLEPDLISVRNSDGVVGYVLRSQLEPPTAASPEDAYQQMKAAMTAGPKAITMYEKDGVTVVGSFTMQPPNKSNVVMVPAR